MRVNLYTKKPLGLSSVQLSKLISAQLYGIMCLGTKKFELQLSNLTKCFVH